MVGLPGQFARGDDKDKERFPAQFLFGKADINIRVFKKQRLQI